MREDIFAIDLESVVQEVYPKLESVEVTPKLEEQTIKPTEYGFSEVTVKGIETEDLNIKPTTEPQTFDGIYKTVSVEKINLQEKTVTPTKEMQVIECENGFDGLNKVNVSAIETEELNIKPSNEVQTFTGMFDKVNVDAIEEVTIEGETLNITPTKETQTFTGLYDQVNVEAIKGETLNITPTETTQTFNGLYETVNVSAMEIPEIETEEITINPDFSTQDTIVKTPTEGKYINKVTLNKDANLVPENILKGTSIYGIDGTGESGIDTSDATATAGDIAKDKTAYVNGEKIVGTMEGTAGFDTSQITSSKEIFLNNKTMTEIGDLDLSGVTQATAMFSNCSSLTKIGRIKLNNCTNSNTLFYNCTSLVEMPFIELCTTSNTNIAMICGGCSNLVTVPELDTSKVTNMSNSFQNCPKLSPESLNNIMAMCIKAIGVSSANKNLYYVGLTSDQRDICKNQSNYQAFLSAGWKLA